MASDRNHQDAQNPASGGANSDDDGTPPLGAPDFSTGRDHERQQSAGHPRVLTPLGKHPPPGLGHPIPKPWTPTLQPPLGKATSKPITQSTAKPILVKPTANSQPVNQQQIQFQSPPLTPRATAYTPTTQQLRPQLAVSGSQSSEDFA